MLSVVQQKVDGLKSSTKAWQATDYLPDFSHEDWSGEVIKLQERANTLSGPLFMYCASDPPFPGSIQSLLDDRQLAHSLGIEGKRHVLRHCTWDSRAEKLEKIYGKLSARCQ